MISAHLLDFIRCGFRTIVNPQHLIWCFAPFSPIHGFVSEYKLQFRQQQCLLTSVDGAACRLIIAYLRCTSLGTRCFKSCCLPQAAKHTPSATHFAVSCHLSSHTMIYDVTSPLFRSFLGVSGGRSQAMPQ